MHFSRVLELHDGIYRANSVGGVLHYFQNVRVDHAVGGGRARGRAGRTVRLGVRRVSSGRVEMDWGGGCGCVYLSCLHLSRFRGFAATSERVTPRPAGKGGTVPPIRRVEALSGTPCSHYVHPAPKPDS